MSGRAGMQAGLRQAGGLVGERGEWADWTAERRPIWIKMAATRRLQ